MVSASFSYTIVAITQKCTLDGFGGCIPCSPFGQSTEIVLYLPTYLNLPVVFLLIPFSVRKCKSSLVETNPGNQIPTTIRFAMPANRWSSSHPPLCKDQSYSDSSCVTLLCVADENLRILHPIVVLLTSETTSFVRIYLHPFLVPTRAKDVKTPSSKTFEGFVYNIFTEK